MKKRKNVGKEINYYSKNFRFLLLEWKDYFKKTMNFKLESLIPKCKDFQMRGALKDLFESLTEVEIFCSYICKQINWEIVEFYNQILEKQLLTNENQLPKCADQNTIEFLKLLNVLLANIQFRCEIKKNDDTIDTVAIKFPVYDKKYDLYTSKEASLVSESIIEKDYNCTILEIEKLMVTLGEEQKKSFEELIDEIKAIDKKTEKNESTHSEKNLLLFLYDNSKTLAAKFKKEFENSSTKSPIKKLMTIKSITLDIYSFRVPCIKCSSLLLGTNDVVFSRLIGSIMKIFSDDLMEKKKKLYRNKKMVELQKKLIFTRNGDGKDLFQKNQENNFTACFSVDYEDPKSYTGEKFFPKSIRIKDKQKLENFLDSPHTFFINDKENKKDFGFVGTLRKLCFKLNNTYSNGN